MLLAGYHRGGYDGSLMAEVATLTQGGAALFAMLADFNDEPDTVALQQELEMLNAEVLAPPSRAPPVGRARLVDASTSRSPPGR